MFRETEFNYLYLESLKLIIMKYYLVYPCLDMFTVSEGVYVYNLECTAPSLGELFKNLSVLLENEDNEVSSVIEFDNPQAMSEYINSIKNGKKPSCYREVFTRYSFHEGGCIVNDYPL